MHKKRFLLVLTLLMLAGSFILPPWSASQEPIEGPIISEPVEPVVLEKDLSTLPLAILGPPQEIPRQGVFFPGVPTEEPFIDPVLQESLTGDIQRGDAVRAGQLSSPILNFNGLRTGANPHDPIGDIGPNHYVQMVNSVFAIYDKTGNLLAGPSAINSLWTSAGITTGPCGTQNAGDPVVLYDPLSNRWVLSQFARPSHVCIAVSRTGNPVAGGWNLYEFNVGSFPDYFKLGVWPDAYYMAANFGGQVTSVAFDRANMLNNNPATFVQFNTAGLPGLGGNMMLPSDLDGSTPPPSNSPNYYYWQVDGNNFGGTDRVEIWEFHVDWGNPANSSFINSVDLALAPFDSALCGFFSFACIPQPNTATTLDPVNEWPMWRLQYRNFNGHETLVSNFAVDVNNSDQSGIRWFELRKAGGAWFVYQEGTFAPQNPAVIPEWQHRWIGSIAMDKQGNIALGYNVSSNTNVFPSLRYTGRLAGDPLGLLPQGEDTIVNGAASIGSNRWGDYSSMNVDPVDDCTFWYTGDYVAAGGLRQTRIASFRFPSCSATDLSISKTATPNPVVAGTQLSYAITVTNNGPNTANNVVVTDVLPAGVIYAMDTDSCVQGPPGTLTCNLGNMTSGQTATFTIIVNVPSGFVSATGLTSITNTASVAALEEDPNQANNTATATTMVKDQADLRLTKECKPDGPAPTGSTATCTIFVDNLGASDARNVVVTDSHLSNGAFTIITAIFSPPAASPCGIVGSTVTCNLGTEPAGGRTIITVQITSSDPVDVNDTATVSSNTPDPDSTNNMAMGRLVFRGMADLSLTKIGAPDPVIAGTNLTYTLNVTNNGPSAAPNVVVKDVLPAEVSMVSFAPSQGSCNGGMPGNPLQPLTCNLGTLASGASATITVVAKVNPSAPEGTILINNAIATSDYSDPNNGNNNATAATMVQTNADLAITKMSDTDNYKPSTTVAYTIAVVNNGPSDAMNVIVTDNLPDSKHVIYQSDTGGCTKVANTLTCNMGTVEPGSSKNFNIYVMVKGSRGEVSNTAMVSSSTTDPSIANNTSTKVVTVKGGI